MEEDLELQAKIAAKFDEFEGWEADDLARVMKYLSVEEVTVQLLWMTAKGILEYDAHHKLFIFVE